jgi:mono/diheme cytochrome c family protein
LALALRQARLLAWVAASISIAVVAWSLVAGAAEQSATSASAPGRPDEPRAAKVYDIFETHCARCHQTGRLQTPLASGGLADIMAVDVISHDPARVRPGFPDASPLYAILESNHAPLDVYAEGSRRDEPRPEDIENVRDWIENLPADRPACSNRKPIRQADVDHMMRDAQRLERDEGGDVRFISLVHLYNACASAADLDLYRQALNKLMNSLSWAAEPVKLAPLDASGTVFSFRLADFGWTGTQWHAIEDAYPETLRHPIADEIRRVAATKVPIVNGDWLAASAASAPLYYRLLDMPTKLSELARMNAVDIEANIRTQAARRIALRESGVTRGNRLIERHPGARGGLWLVYDFATSSGDQDIFEHPAGPKGATADKAPFKPDEIRAEFSLPNGFAAFALFDADGNRLDRVLPGIEKPYKGQDLNTLEPVTNAGANCFACHVSGPVPAKDEYRAAEPLDKTAPPSPSRVAALPLFGNDSENALLMLGAADRYRTAAMRVGVDLSARIRGEELVSRLARRYREHIGFEAALAETGLDRQVLLDRLRAATGSAAPLARRLLNGTLSREELDRLFELTSGADRTAAATRSGGFLRDVKSEIGLSLWTDDPKPKRGDLVTIEAQTDSDCYLTIVSVDASGMATVLFPNDFDHDNLLRAGATLSVPAADAAYQFRFKAEGSETILARCSQRSAPPIGIEHDFEHQRFTVLGNWENFIHDTLVTDAELRTDPQKAERARIAQSAAQRRLGLRPEVDQRLGSGGDKSLRDGRAALVIGGG